MIEEGRYCPEILTQLRAIRSALKSVELGILETHLSYCVDQAFLSSDQEVKRERIEEVHELIKRFD